MRLHNAFFVMILNCSYFLNAKILPMKFSVYDIPANTVVVQTALSYVTVNLRPFLPYHLLACPIRIVDRVKDMTDEEHADLSIVIHRLTRALDSLGSSWTITCQDGKDAGQTVKHVHYHVIPRNLRDIANNDEIYENIDKSYLKRDRTDEEMAKEAAFLREAVEKSGIKFD